MTGIETSSAQPDIRNPAFLIADAAYRYRTTRNWADHVSIILAQVGKGLDLSRAYLFQVHELEDGGLGQTCRMDWAADGLPRLNSASQGISERILETDELMQLWAERRRRGEMIEGHARHLTGRLKTLFDSQQTKSFLSFPIWVSGAWWGHIGFDECRNERAWTLTEKSVLRGIAYLTGDAVELSASSLGMSEATRKAVLNAAPDGIIVIDEAGAILDFNPAAELIFDRRQADVFGRRVVDVLRPAAEDQNRFRALMRRLQHGRSEPLLGQRMETSILRSDGSSVPVDFMITEIRHTGRRLFVAYVQDLTERKRAEAQAVRHRESLHQSEKMTALGSLLAGVAHELNNPLSVVVGRAIMLEEQAVDPNQRDLLRRLREAAERCAKVAKTFLAIARQSPAVRAPMLLNRAILSALDLVSYSLRSSGVGIRLEFDEKLPEVTADFDQLVQVFVNLFVNAEHAMRDVHGERRLTISTHADRVQNTVCAVVKDTGPGIGPEIRPRIFEPFFTTKAAGVGTGMGLAVSFGMVSAHGGLLEAIEPEDRGACFRITLPIGQTAQPHPAPVAQSRPLPPKRRILVIDDEPEITSLIREILERAGHEVDDAENGLDALTRTKANRYDAIFCDIRMPRLDGRSFRKQLLAHDPIYEKRMVFVTGDLLGSAGEDDVEGCPIVEKPFYVRTILDALDRIVG